jgi:hypothetical protein
VAKWGGDLAMSAGAHGGHIVPDTWVTLFARFAGREVWMPWKESSVMEERLRFVARLLDGELMTHASEGLHLRDRA